MPKGSTSDVRHIMLALVLPWQFTIIMIEIMVNIKLTINKRYRIEAYDGHHIVFKLLGFGPNGLLVEINGVHHEEYQLPPWRSIMEMSE